MQILEHDDHWVLEHQGKHETFQGIVYWDDRSELVSAIENRGFFVWSDGSIKREAEQQKPDDDPSKYDTPDLPHEDHPKPTTPDSPSDEKPKPKKVDSRGISKRAAKANRERAAKAAPKTDAPRRGRPPIFTPEEAAERRRAKNREYSAKRTEAQREAARERARKWREENPDKVKAARKKSMEARAERYDNDPEYRARFNQYQRDYKRAQRAGDTEGAAKIKHNFETYTDGESVKS